MDVEQDPTKIHHNKSNRKLQEGCDVLGYKWHATGQNVDTRSPCAGFIPFGDRFGVKRDGRVSFLAKAVSNGARILDNCEALGILTTVSKGTKKATGVLCRRGNQQIRIQGRRGVILAAGSLHSPCLLLKSRFHNSHIGKHLRLHPATGVYGRFPETINCFMGAPMTTVVTDFEEGPLGNGYGAKIECASIHPGIAASAVQVLSPALVKEHMLMFRRAVSFIVLQRDSSEGRVRVGLDGFPVVDYALNSHDKASIVQALQGATRILLANRTEHCATTHRNDVLGIKSKIPPSRTKDEIDSTYAEALSAIKTRGLEAHDICMFSAHQMGTCRMSSSPITGVVDCNGETWECDDLTILDASIFPTATAVNPMMTVLAMSHMLSSRLALRLMHEDDEAANGCQRRERKRCPRSFWSYTTRISLLGPAARFIQVSAPAVALFWFWLKSKPSLKITGA